MAHYTFVGDVAATSGVTVSGSTTSDYLMVNDSILLGTTPVGRASSGTMSLTVSTPTVAGAQVTWPAGNTGAGGVVQTSDHKGLQVTIAGVYQVSYHVVASNAAAMSWKTTFNNVDIAGSLSASINGSLLRNVSIAVIPANAVVHLVNAGLNTTTLVSASIGVTFLGVLPSTFNTKSSLGTTNFSESATKEILATTADVAGALELGGTLTVPGGGGIVADTVTASNSITYSGNGAEVGVSICGSLGTTQFVGKVNPNEAIPFQLAGGLAGVSVNSTKTSLTTTKPGTFAITATITSTNSSTWILYLNGTGIAGTAASSYGGAATISVNYPLAANDAISVVNAGGAAATVVYANLSVTLAGTH